MLVAGAMPLQLCMYLLGSQQLKGVAAGNDCVLNSEHQQLNILHSQPVVRSMQPERVCNAH